MRLRTVRKDPLLGKRMEHPGWVYTILCENRKLYVGWTALDHLPRRIAQHFSGNGSKWTMLHRPVCVLAVIEGGKALETATTAALMARYGVDSVRGAGWCRLEMAEPDWLKQGKDYKKWKDENEQEPNVEP